MYHVYSFGTLLFCLLFSATSQATIIHFDFTGGGSNSSVGGHLSFSAGGLDLRVRARGHDDNGVFQDAKVTHGNNGLGVKTDDGDESTNELDSMEGNERLRFMIDGLPAGAQSVSLVGMHFSNAFQEGDFDFRLNIAGSNLGVFEPDSNPWDLTIEPGLDAADLLLSSTGFFFITVDEDFNPLAEFRIAGLDFKVNASEPHIFLLLMLGLATLFVQSRNARRFR